MDQPKLERLLRLMKLLTANTTYNVDQLAERLHMSRRTVYRYIDTFREAGFVIKKSGDCIRLDKESPHFRDISQLVHFTEEEAVILRSAIENIDDTNLLKQNLKRKLCSVYDNRTLADTVVRGKNAPNIRRLIEAIEERRHAEGFIDVFRMHGEHRIRVRLELGMLACNLLCEEYPLAERDIRPLRRGRWLLDTEVAGMAGVGRFVVGLLDDIRIVDSPELTDYLREYLRKNAIE